MQAFNLCEHYQMMEAQEVILSFKGEFSQEILISVGDLLKEKLSNDDARQRIAKKIFFIFVELAQNIYRYSSERTQLDNKRIGTGVLVIREHADCFTIFAGNAVTTAQAETIAAQCVYINELGPDELKNAYKDRLKSPRQEGQIGGGVGLISIVRKAGHPLRLETTPLDAEHAFLVLSIQVDKEERDE